MQAVTKITTTKAMNLAFVHSGHVYSLLFIQMNSQETNTCKIYFYNKATAHFGIGVRSWEENIDFYKM